MAPSQTQPATVAAMQTNALATASRSFNTQPAAPTHIAPAPIAPAPAPATVSVPSPRTVAPVIVPRSSPDLKSIAAAPKPRRVSTTPLSSPPPNHPHPFIQTVPQPAMRAVPQPVPLPVSQPVSQAVSHQSLQSVLHSALQSAAAALQPPTTISTAVVPTQKARAITKGKQQLQEDDDDEDDEEDDEDEVDDAHLVPSERHLHSFIGHWQVLENQDLIFVLCIKKYIYIYIY